MSNVAIAPVQPMVPQADSASPPVDERPEYVMPEERERRLLYLMDRWLDGVPRRHLIEMAMECFHVTRRSAQRYVKTVEMRLRNQAAKESPLAYLQRSKLQRENWLGRLSSCARKTEDPKTLMQLAAVFNKLCDSRDHVAALILQARNEQGNGQTTIRLEIQQLQASKLLREGKPFTHPGQPPGLPAPDEDSLDDIHAAGCGVEAASSRLDEVPEEAVPPEIIAQLDHKVREGCTEDEAIRQVFEKLQRENPIRYARIGYKMMLLGEKKKNAHDRGSGPESAVSASACSKTACDRFGGQRTT